MNDVAEIDAYGTLAESTTLKIQRLLPGPIDRVWAYVTESDLRRQWLAAGDMVLKPDTPFRLVWRNEELSDPPGKRPEGFGEEHSLDCRVIEASPPHRLFFAWGERMDVAIDLEERGTKVLLTLTHRRLPDRSTLLNVSAGWHSHLDILVAKVEGRKPGPFWDAWLVLKSEYEKRLP